MNAPLRAAALALMLVLGVATAVAQSPGLPNRSGSVKFAVIGDFGDGGKGEYEIGAVMGKMLAAFDFDFGITVGDNIYGSERPQDFKIKFELPFKAVLDKGVTFYASLGNHDDPNQRFYKPFNMNGERYYAYTKKNALFLALDSNYMDTRQLAWIEDQLKSSKAEWKIPYFHHPLYSSGGKHGSSPDLREALEPLFLKYGVQVVFAGHDHFYERTKPQKGIYHFVAGSTGKLRKGDISKTALTASGFDTARGFMLVEIADDAMFFAAVAQTGKVFDAGCIPRSSEASRSSSRVRCPPPSAPAEAPAAAPRAGAPAPTPPAGTPASKPPVPGSKPPAAGSGR